MIEAARTLASPAATWAIVIVAVSCLAFWLSMIMIADRQQVKASGPSLMPGEPVQALGGTRQGAARRDHPATLGVPGQRAAEAPAGPLPADAPTRPDLRVYREMPAQRSGEGDRAERSGSAPRDER